MVMMVWHANAQEGTPDNEIPDVINNPELNLSEDKTLLFEPERTVISEKSTQNKEQIVPAHTKNNKQKLGDSTPKQTSRNPEEDALSFNFLYYIIQKFKISDIVEQ